ncbi:MAG: serine protease [Phycisphaerales bacterium]|nr:serine protease [Phycisphaerales bacterium]
MSPSTHFVKAISLAVFIPLLVLGNAMAHTERKADYEKLHKKASSSLVTIKCVLKIQGMGGNREFEREFTGVMIDPKGLVLCSGVRLGTSKMMRGFGTVTPTNIKILSGNDTEGEEAKLLTSDPDLDLSWVQIEKPRAKGYAYLNLSQSKTPKLGATLLTMKRLDKFFDRTAVISEGRLSGITKKPRKLFVPTSSLDVDPGMPVFSQDGTAIGIVVLQSPDPEDMDANSRQMSNSTAALILPSAEVMKATKRARITAESEGSEEEEEEEE